MKAQIERIPISRIEVSERRRKKLGPIASLAKSLDEHGLLHPIIVTDDLELVAGERRLRAAEKLGWKSIPARRFSSLTDEELRAIELEENTQRLDLDDYEASKARLAEIEAVEAEIHADKPAQLAQVYGGRANRGGNSEVSRRTGLARDEIRRTKAHVAAGEKYPVLKAKGWTRGAALDATEALDALPTDAQATVLEMLSEPGVPPKTAKAIIENVSGMAQADQRQLGKLYRSGDPEQESLAKARAVRLPPAPPARMRWVKDAIALTERALADSRIAKSDLRSALSGLKAALKAYQADYQETRKREGF